jgi:hypothetical protein
VRNNPHQYVERTSYFLGRQYLEKWQQFPEAELQRRSLRKKTEVAGRYGDFVHMSCHPFSELWFQDHSSP